MPIPDALLGLGRALGPDVAGAPVDVMQNLLNLGIAGGGYLGHKAGLLNQPPELLKNSVGGSDWLASKTNTSDTGTTAYTAGTVIPLLFGLGGPKTPQKLEKVAELMQFTGKQEPAKLRSLKEEMMRLDALENRAAKSAVQPGTRYIQEHPTRGPSIYEVEDMNRAGNYVGTRRYQTRGFEKGAQPYWKTERFELTEDQLLAMQKHDLQPKAPE